MTLIRGRRDDADAAPPVGTVSRKSSIPSFDTLTRTPLPATERPSSMPVGEDLPTFRLPARAASSAIGSGAPDPLTTTPPPKDDLKLSASAWSGGEDDDFPPTTRAPRIGETIQGFRLVGELGRGAFARVFLAHQEALADRPVALKVTLRPTREAERLARLQHTNVVPVYSVHDAAPAQLICMPYLGRVTLADLIRAYRVECPSRLSGRKSTSARAARTTAVDSGSKSASRSATDPKAPPGPARAPVWTWQTEEAPPIVGDPRAVLQVLAQLAAGLGHAHDRGILHLDIKPANVLLADTGEPMLLDFNLSFDASRPDREMVGGTMPYMAIEQLLDMRARGKGAIDRRTDLYSLGVLAFELLTGTVPFPATREQLRDLDQQMAARRQGPPALRPLNPGVTPAVEAIVRKLLAPEPGDRYQTTDELRADIERHLADLPLWYARERSVRERFGKWRRRNPGIVVRLAAACVVGLAVGLGGAVYSRTETIARNEAVDRARIARATLNATRLDLVILDDPKAQMRGAERATQLLAEYGLPGDADWRARPDVRRLTAEDRAGLTGDLGELMVLLAETRWRQAAARPESDRRELIAEAWKLNVAARACFGDAVPMAAVRQAAVLAPAAGEPFDAFAHTPDEHAPTPRALFLDASAALARGRYVGAIELLDRVVEAEPDHAAAQFCLAYCRQQVGQYQRALERFDTARVLMKTDPRPAYQRGLMYATVKKPDQADAEFTKAIALDPNHADAYRFRALARLRLGTKSWKKGGEKDRAAALEGAEADLAAALEHGAPVLFVHFIRAYVRDARGDKAGAISDRAATKDTALKTEGDYLVRGWCRLEDDPKGALADFRKAAELNPRSLGALQNQAHVLADKLNDTEGALVVATKVADMYPEFAPARSGRAVVLARLGRRDEAHKEIELARQISADAEITYQAASVYSLTSVTHAADRLKALELLRQAIREGYGDLCAMEKDGDMKPLHAVREYQEIMQAAKSLYR